MAVVDRDRAHLDAMIAGIAHDLRRRVETHRLGVEQSGTEYVGMMMLHPARGIGDLRKARCMALRKAIAPEALDLLEGALGKILGITPFDHAADELVVEMRYPARQFEGRHRPPQLIGFGRGDARDEDRTSVV